MIQVSYSTQSTTNYNIILLLRFILLFLRLFCVFPWLKPVSNRWISFLHPVAAGKVLNVAVCRKNVMTIVEFPFKIYGKSIPKPIFSKLKKDNSYCAKCFWLFLMPSSLKDEISWDPAILSVQLNWVNWITAGIRIFFLAQCDIDIWEVLKIALLIKTELFCDHENSFAIRSQ